VEKLIIEASKIRDVKGRRRFLKKRGIKGAKLEEILEKSHFLAKGKKKFPRADQMKFTRESLAQASSKSVAEYRTLKMREKLGTIRKILDVCSGIGGDTIAMGLRWNVISVERDPTLTQMLAHNVGVYNLQNKVEIVRGDILELLKKKSFLEKLKEIDCIFFDPSRRAHGKRTVKVEEYDPPLSTIDLLKEICPNICVKISPGVEFDRINFECDIEVISYKGEVREVVLWFGRFKVNDERKTILATKLPEKITWEKKGNFDKIRVGSLYRFLYEPDPAFIKAHLIDDIASVFNLSLLNKRIAYLTGDSRVESPILKRYMVLGVSEIDSEVINKKLTDLNIGIVDLKARGVKIDLKMIHKSIRGLGKSKGLVIFSQVMNEKKAILCRYD
jgi:hypothetical protein